MAVRDIHDIEQIERVPLRAHALPANTLQIFDERAAKTPDAPALTFFLDADRHDRSHTWTFAELRADIVRTANVLASLGVGAGDVAAFVLPNLPETHFAIWGGEAAGIAMAINPLLDGAQIAELVDAARAKVLLCVAPTPGVDIWPKLAPHLDAMPTVEAVVWVDLRPYVSLTKRAALAWIERREKARPGTRIRIVNLHAEMRRQPGDRLIKPRTIAPDEPSSYFCTGGTTGRPKIAVRTHGCEVFDVWSASETQVRDGDDARTVFCGLPLFHVNGQLVTGLMAWLRGHHVVLGTPQGYRGKNVIARFWEIVEAYRINAFSGVPTLYAALLQQPVGRHDIGSLEYAACGAAPMPVELARSFERMTGVKIVEGYGLTESACVASLNPLDGERRIGSIGLRLPYQRMRAVIVDDTGRYVRDALADEVGLIALSGPNVFRGYLDPAHERGLWIDVAGERWLNTGDLGRRDADGYFWLVGRKKELIIRGGHNIDPRVIEDALAAHPAVALAAAIGRPDAHAGELPVAYVQLKTGASADADALLAFAAGAIFERAAVPKHVRILDAVPTTAVGKIFKPELQRLEIADVVAACARDAQAALERIDVVQDARRGLVAKVAVRGPRDALAEQLARYAFPVDWVGERAGGDVLAAAAFDAAGERGRTS
ncbi:acyl-CoA synthetase [Burkholderia mayonis]|uniref:Acyl-CoA synthetase n=1 Tax=Burkholderia mayonis TaxID=1385591 RepID=A0A1B4FDR8_9BURK|nr:acyl-CoA synthetase [Burkholderia mayonis]AOJ01850.1 acyl-CoA synthetase [Burkholderia mayonis]KVE47290.1 acyl-CoA synthetase [Burkholderia mayonis]